MELHVKMGVECTSAQSNSQGCARVALKYIESPWSAVWQERKWLDSIPPSMQLISTMLAFFKGARIHSLGCSYCMLWVGAPQKFQSSVSQKETDSVRLPRIWWNRRSETMKQHCGKLVNLLPKCILWLCFQVLLALYKSGIMSHLFTFPFGARCCVWVSRSGWLWIFFPPAK